MPSYEVSSHILIFPSYHHHPFELTIMVKKGRKQPETAIHLPGGALQTTFAVEGMIYI